MAREDPELAALIPAVLTSEEPKPLATSTYCYILEFLEEGLAADGAFGAFEGAAGIDCGREREEDEADEDKDEEDDEKQELKPVVESSGGYLEEEFFADFDWSSGSGKRRLVLIGRLL